nr:hypothetical protein K-LCC10_0138 [Kaumoebavirus]
MEVKSIRKAITNILSNIEVDEEGAEYSAGRIISIKFNDKELACIYLPVRESDKVTHYADNTEYKSYDREELLNGVVAKDILPGILYDAAIRSFEEKKENEP